MIHGFFPPRINKPSRNQPNYQLQPTQTKHTQTYNPPNPQTHPMAHGQNPPSGQNPRSGQNSPNGQNPPNDKTHPRHNSQPPIGQNLPNGKKPHMLFLVVLVGFGWFEWFLTLEGRCQIGSRRVIKKQKNLILQVVCMLK